MYRTTTYQTLDDTLLKKWRNLWNNSKDGHFFNTPDWFLATCEVYNVKNFKIITIEENHELVLILPLVRQKIFGVSVWSCPGGKFLNKSSLLIQKNEKSIFQQLEKYLLLLGNFYLQEVSGEIADSLFKTNNNVIKREASTNPYLSLSPDPFCYLSSKNKSQIRGILRKNEKALAFKTFVGDSEALNTAFSLDMISSKKDRGKATFVTKKDKDFFRELLKRMSQNFIIDIVYYNATPIVYGIGFIYKNTYHASLTAFDGTYRFLRPGKLLAYYLLQRLQKDRYSDFDFGRGKSALKDEFTKLTKFQYDMFYVKPLFARQMVIFRKKAQDGIISNKFLYSTYLFFKTIF